MKKALIVTLSVNKYRLEIVCPSGIDVHTLRTFLYGEEFDGDDRFAAFRGALAQFAKGEFLLHHQMTVRFLNGLSVTAREVMVMPTGDEK